MTNRNRTIILILVIVFVVTGIWYLQSTKPKMFSGKVQDVQTNNAGNKNRQEILAEKSKEYPKAKEIADPTGFINASPFALSDLVGKKVILVDFWTYSCINCQRTLPYLKAWYQKYKDQGLAIVGVHTPEFDFEKDYSNVARAVKDAGIEYPVVLDSNYATWNAYGNSYWPREYLIDIDGYIVHDHIGEGGYDETERAIQKALQERALVLGARYSVDNTVSNPSDTIPMDATKIQSPETYFGAERNQYLANGSKSVTGIQNLSIPNALEKNALYLGGKWNFTSQFAESIDQSTIEYAYVAKNVYLVASAKSGATIKIFLDGKLLSSKFNKNIAPDGTMVIGDHKLYTLINGLDYAEHTLKILVENPGLDAYTFTFG